MFQISPISPLCACAYFYRTQARSLATLVTDYYLNSLTPVVDLTDMTLAFEDSNSQLLDVGSVADVDADERFDTVELLKLRFSRHF